MGEQSVMWRNFRFLCMTNVEKSNFLSISSRDGRPAPPREKQALPRPAEIDKTRGAQRGKADCRLHRLCPHIWAKNGEENEMKEKLFIWSFVQLVIIWFAENVMCFPRSKHHTVLQILQ